ncbi:Enoyl-CoA hydratase/carnithine racemase [Pedobacter westerhofensis]|uniref:Enoyl-CoA hydratase/carnithine racemase n=1 Tax=Pedobacter westerhofensis TaxID=425512 RepID=A0A521BQM6_9SPHI|nr:enoyl-CoA hydratase/isomerase family protein [Pedobacter westerhofensis]SMO49355.1 Enoyl-CoA hydratase/carnithine racemase [Pedobacter westerhofensis]
MTTIISPLQIKAVNAGYWRVTINNPPLNVMDPELFAAFRLLLDKMNNDKDLKVVVLESGNPDHFIAHLDSSRSSEIPDIPGAASIVEDWANLVLGFANSPVVTIALIRERVRGIGQEFILALDMRFASAERAVFAQSEIGFSIVPGGGALEWMPRLIGRSRTLELVLGGDTIDAKTAEMYGLINRALPENNLEAFVEHLALRIAGFSKEAIADNKALINKRSGLPLAAEFHESFAAINTALARPEALERIGILRDRGYGKPSQLELDLPRIIGTLGYELAGRKLQ